MFAPCSGAIRRLGVAECAAAPCRTSPGISLAVCGAATSLCNPVRAEATAASQSRRWRTHPHVCASAAFFRACFGELLVLLRFATSQAASPRTRSGSAALVRFQDLLG